MIKVEVGDKVYKVDLAITDAQKKEGLQYVSELPEDRGMLFVYDKPQDVGFWMQLTPVALDIVFIDEDMEVLAVEYGEPLSETMITHEDVKYVLEVNANSGIEAGDYVDIDEKEESNAMQVIGPNGEVQMELEGGERIFSRPNTKALVKLAKKAYETKDDKDYKALGKRVFKYLDKQDSNKPEFVEK